MNKPLILAALLSASAALAACDRADQASPMTGTPGTTDNSVTMPVPAPQNTAPLGAPVAPAPTPGTTTPSPGTGTGTGSSGMSQ